MRRPDVEYIGVERPINGNMETCAMMLSFDEFDFHPRYEGSSVWIFMAAGKWWILPRTLNDEPFQAGPFKTVGDAVVHLKLIAD